MVEPPGTMRTPLPASSGFSGIVSLSTNGQRPWSADMSTMSPKRKPSRMPCFTQAFTRQPAGADAIRLRRARRARATTPRAAARTRSRACSRSARGAGREQRGRFLTRDRSTGSHAGRAVYARTVAGPSASRDRAARCAIRSRDAGLRRRPAAAGRPLRAAPSSPSPPSPGSGSTR